MKEIQLTQGKVALVDDEDFKRVSQFKWQYLKVHGMEYAKRGKYELGKQSTQYMHVFILGEIPGMEIDHIKPSNSLNNQKSNLRHCTHSENMMNRRLNKNGSSQYKGVSWHIINKKWRAQIQLNKKCIYIGYFTDETEAALAYNKKAVELFGEFARLNIPNN